MNIAVNRIGAPRRTDGPAPAIPAPRRFAHRLAASVRAVAAAIIAANDTRVPF